MFPLSHSRRGSGIHTLFPLLVLLLTLFSLTTSAFAQTNRLPMVAVLDFTVPRSGNDAIVSRQATDAFVTELQRTGIYDVIPRAQVDRGIADLELTSPLTRSDLTRLGESLSADYIAIGRVEDISRKRDPDRLVARLRILLFDVATGEYANGARVNGSRAVTDATTTDLPDTDPMTFQAISDAAFNAARAIRNYQLPEATVLITTGDTVWLNGGVRNGIHVGQEFIILRRGQQVGRVRVTSVSGQDARAYIIDAGRGIRPEDKARAVVNPADLPTTP